MRQPGVTSGCGRMARPSVGPYAIFLPAHVRTLRAPHRLTLPADGPRVFPTADVKVIL